MKLLLDENLPKRLKEDFSIHQVFTVSDMEWTGKKNGELMTLMVENNFQALITFDKNLQYQQNFKKYVIAVIVLSVKDNTYKTLTQLSKIVLEKISSKLDPGPLEIKI